MPDMWRNTEDKEKKREEKGERRDEPKRTEVEICENMYDSYDIFGEQNRTN